MAGTDEDRDQRELRFRRLYHAYFRPVQAHTVNRLGPVDEVADVVAEVFLTAWRRLPDIPPQLTYAEAAETLGCSVNAIGIRVHKAKARLRELLATDTLAGPPAPAPHQAERSQ